MRSLSDAEWQPGEMIPSEMALAQRFQVSQGTVRKAINELVAENMLMRRQGKGTFVATHTDDGTTYRFLHLRNLADEQTYPQSTFIGLARIKADAQIAKRLAIRKGNPLVNLQRVLTLAGKTVVYDVTYISVSQPKFPELDADFAKSLGVADGDVKTMRAEIKLSLEQEVEKRVKARVKEGVFQALIAESKLEVPKVLVEAETNRMMQMTAQNLQQRGMPAKDIQLTPAMFTEQATRSTTLRLILSEVVNANNLQANADQVRAVVDTFANSYEKPEELVQWYYADVQRLDEPAALATEENVVNWVLEKAKVTNKKIKFDELMAG